MRQMIYKYTKLRGSEPVSILILLAILGSTQLVPNWRVSNIFSRKDKAKIEQLAKQLEAQALGYDSVAKAATYVSSLNAKFAAEAAYFVTLRDACWLLYFAALGDPPAVKPTPAEFADAIVAKALASVGMPDYT